MASKIVNIRIADHTDEVLKALDENTQKALNACGQEMEGYTKDECPVDTGRLRNSITYATKTFHSKGNDRWDKGATASATSKDMATKGSPDKRTLYVGTNVEYAISVEYKDRSHKTGRAHFLRNAATNHSEHYKAIIEAALNS